VERMEWRSCLSSLRRSDLWLFTLATCWSQIWSANLSTPAKDMVRLGECMRRDLIYLTGQWQSSLFIAKFYLKAPREVIMYISWSLAWISPRQDGAHRFQKGKTGNPIPSSNIWRLTMSGPVYGYSSARWALQLNVGPQFLSLVMSIPAATSKNR